MLYLGLSVLVYLASSQYGGPTFDDINHYLINTCVNTSSAFSLSSEICYCSDRSVHCNYYEDGNCTKSMYDSQSIMGGCSSENWIYRTDDCTAAQDTYTSLKDIGQSCPYWVDSSGNVWPLNQCRAGNCPGSTFGQYSCMDTVNGNDIERLYFEDYICSNFGTETTYSGNQIRRLNSNSGDTSSNCGVASTEYDLDGDEICGSSKSPFDTSVSSGTFKYYKRFDGALPYSVGQCFYSRQGYYSYSGKYECNADGDMITLTHWLDSNKCSGDGYVVSSWSNDNATISCEGGNTKGTVGFYDTCGNYNWDASFSQTPIPWGKCIKVYSDPDNFVDRPLIAADQPWYYNLSYVFSCNSVGHSGGGSYPSVYWYTNSDKCKGDYVFTFDIYGYISQINSYKGLKCAYPQVTNCGQGSKLDIDDIPGSFTCSSAIKLYSTQVFAVVAFFAFLLF